MYNRQCALYIIHVVCVYKIPSSKGAHPINGHIWDLVIDEYMEINNFSNHTI